LNIVVAPAGTPSARVRNVGGTNYTCAVNLTNPTANCIPAPPLTAAVLGGQLPQDWIDYTWVDVVGKTIYEESLLTAYFDGGLFDLPAGKIRMGIGAEFRQARINDTPAIDSQNSNLYNLTASALTRGKDEVAEFYTEIEIPVLRDLPGADELTLNLSGRYTDYDSYGSDETYKISLAYKPVSWVTLRSTFGTSYRAPALFEQFLGATTGFLSTASDPCNNWDAAGVNPVRRANCQSEGLPPGFLQTSGITVFSQGGAAQGLEAETSENFTVGLVFRPDFLPEGFGDLALAIDYYDIEIDNGVARVGSTNLFNLCYNDPGFRSSTGQGYCTYVQRDANRRVTVFDSYTNVSTQTAVGIDYNLRYTRDIGPGRFRANLEVQTFREQGLQTLPTSVLREFNGTIGQPKMTGELDLTYTWGSWRVRTALEHVGSMDSNVLVGNTLANGSVDPRFVFAVPSVNYLHGSVEYRADKWTGTLGMRNITDKVPPPISFGVYNRVGNGPLYSGYDYYGRTAFMNVIVKF
jgi:outer membrane receptor protein involved in Fe transport